MIKSFRIFLRDVKRISRRPVAVILALGVMVLPSLYAWFNIQANWDPYGNTSSLKVAVANIDEGSSINGLSVNVGDQIIEKLKTNDQIGWQFVSKENAMMGVENGRYYAAIIIPADFSSKISSILSDDIEQAEIIYYVNEKKNAIAPKITNSGVNSLQTTVNQTFIETATGVVFTALNMTEEEFENMSVNPLNGMMTTLAEMNDSLGSLNLLISALSDTVHGADTLTDTASNLLPDTEDLLNNTTSGISQLQSTITASRAVITELSAVTASTIDTTVMGTRTLADTLEQAFNTLESDANAAANIMLDISDSLDIIRRTNSKINSTMLEFKSFLTAHEKILKFLTSNSSYNKTISKINEICDLLADINSSVRDTQNSLNEAASQLKKTGEFSADTMTELRSQLRTLQSRLEKIRNEYNTYVSPQVSELTDSVFNNLDALSGILTSASSIIPGIGNTIEGVKEVTAYGVSALESTDKLIENSREKITSIIEELEAVSSDNRLDQLVQIIRNDPSLAASFMASPVQITTEKIYPIDNYGSAMAPFYSVLAVWVGGLILSSILKTDVREDMKFYDLKHYHTFFARYFMFASIGVIQALIIALGDLYLLKIQCLYPGRFILASVICALVYTFIIYTLTSSFGDIGKAVAVVFMVIQVAGAGGTFPIELLPKVYGAINPYFPFTCGINAMRECIGGMYGNVYWGNLAGMCALYVPLNLIIGLLLRKQVHRLKEAFESKIEETGVM